MAERVCVLHTEADAVDKTLQTVNAMVLNIANSRKHDHCFLLQCNLLFAQSLSQGLLVVIRDKQQEQHNANPIDGNQELHRN